MSIVYIIIAVAAIILLWLPAAYNSFVRGRNLVKEAWSGIDVQLKRRYDLIPNLVETVKGYAGHEKEVFEKVAEMRTRSMNAGSVNEKAQAEGELTGALKSLFAVAEAYPELKANQNFMELQNSLQQVEDQLQLARRYYNGTARDFNNSIETFPNVLIAGMFGFTRSEYFELENEAERANPEVKF